MQYKIHYVMYYIMQNIILLLRCMPSPILLQPLTENCNLSQFRWYFSIRQQFRNH